MVSTNCLSGWNRPENVGIMAVEVYFPRFYVCQKDLEIFDGVSEGKYVIGLGQSKMGFCSDREDVHSLCLTVLNRLMEKTGISYSQIGRLDVGTESLLDKSKSVKTILMKLFEEEGNYDVQGVDSLNACYGGTAALMNSINWIESSSWDGRFAVVVAGDIAVYAEGAARPTGGAGAVALLIGPDAPVAFDSGLLSSYMAHTYDFYKPDLSSDYPVVDGRLSIQCYLKALDKCYQTYLNKASRRNETVSGSEARTSSFPTCIEDFDAFIFHSPFCKLVQKSFARFVFNDFLRCPPSLVDQNYPDLGKFRGTNLEETYFNKDIEKAFLAYSEQMFNEKTKPSLCIAKNVGNMYTPSLYGAFFSLLASKSAPELRGKRVGFFSYGSGTASSIFSFRFRDEPEMLDKIRVMTEDASKFLPERLETRVKISPAQFTDILKQRETTSHKASYSPTSDISILFPGTWYLVNVDDQHRRKYDRAPLSASQLLVSHPICAAKKNSQFCSSPHAGLANGATVNGVHKSAH